jgi:hypothetical protein
MSKKKKKKCYCQQIWRGLSFNPNFLSIGPTVRIAGQDILKTKKSSEKGKKFSDPPLSTRH